MLKGSAHRTFDEILQLPIFDVSLECKDISLSTATRKGIDQLVEYVLDVFATIASSLTRRSQADGKGERGLLREYHGHR